MVTASALGNSPLQLMIRWSVLVSDISKVSQDLGAVDGQTGEQDELLPRGTQQACVVLDGELTEERQLLNPRDLTEEQLVGQTAQQGKELHLSHSVPATETRMITSDLLFDTIILYDLHSFV